MASTSLRPSRPQLQSSRGSRKIGHYNTSFRPLIGFSSAHNRLLQTHLTANVPINQQPVAAASMDEPTAGGLLGLIDLGEEHNVNKRGESAVRDELWDTDPGLNQTLISSGTTVAQLFNQDTWEHHRRIDRYFEHVTGIPQSTVFRRILKPLLFMLMVASTVCYWNQFGPSHLSATIALVPHTLLGAALSLLLVFRTNSCYQRFQTARGLWGAIIRDTRDWCRLSMLYMPPDMADRAGKLVLAWAHATKCNLRQGRTRDDPNDPTKFRDDPSRPLRNILGNAEAEELLATRNIPYSITCKMTALVQEAYGHGRRGGRSAGLGSRHINDSSNPNMPGRYGINYLPRFVAERLDISIAQLIANITTCEGILSTPIPISYTRHTTRSLMLWLTTLPLALWQPMGWYAIPAVACISFIFLGIDEIGIEIEEPFAVLPITPIVNNVITRDVGVAQSFSTDSPSAAKSIASGGWPQPANLAMMPVG